MALTLSISVEQTNACGTLVITDTTGAYGVTNTGGWLTDSIVAGCIAINDESVIEAYLEFSNDSGTTLHKIDLMDSSKWQAYTPYTSGSPFDSSTNPTTLVYTIPIVDIFGTNLPDGIITMRYYVTDGSTVADYTFSIAIFCEVRRQYFTLVAKIPEHYQCVTCDNKFVDMVMVVSGLYKALKLSAAIGDTAKFLFTLKELQDIFETIHVAY